MRCRVTATLQQPQTTPDTASNDGGGLQNQLVYHIILTK